VSARTAAAVLLLATACSAGAHAPAAAPATPTTPVATPTPTPTVSVSPDGTVVVRDGTGAVVSESSCGDDYEPGVALMTALRDGLRAGDRAAVTRLLAFPLTWGGKPLARDTFDYDKVFSPNAVATITARDPRALFCRNGEVALGAGDVWGAQAEDGRYLVVTVNV
jgi:hypothetical protein